MSTPSAIPSSPSAIPSSPISSGISLSGLLLLSRLHSSVARRECCPLLQPFLLSDCAQPLQPLPSAQTGFQPLVWGSGCSGVGYCLDGVRNCTGHCSTQSTGLEQLCFPSGFFFPLLSSMTADLCCWSLVRALRVLLATLLFPLIIHLSMFLHCSSIHFSFVAFILLVTHLFTFLCPSPSVLVYLYCFSCRLWSHRSRTSFVTKVESSFPASQGPFQLFRVALLLYCLQECLHRCLGHRGLQTFHLP